MSIDVIICRRTSTRCKCGGRAAGKCGYELRGKRAGQRCNADVCPLCGVIKDGRALCHPHARLAGVKVG